MIKPGPKTTTGLVLGFLGFFCLLATGCSADSQSGEPSESLTVFAAASLTAAFTELGAAFELQSPGTTVAFNFAGSQRLRTQLEHGAMADIFASADWRQMEAIQALSLTSSQATVFASNRLVIITPAGTLLGDAIPTDGQAKPSTNPPRSDTNRQPLRYLAKPGIKLVLALAQVPVGAYSREAINSIGADPEFGADYAQRVLANLVSEETNVRDIVQKVALGEADAGIVYQTNATAPGVTAKIDYFTVPDPFNVTATYPISALKGNARPELGQAFIAFLGSEPGQAILARHGFLPPAE